MTDDRKPEDTDGATDSSDPAPEDRSSTTSSKDASPHHSYGASDPSDADLIDPESGNTMPVKIVYGLYFGGFLFPLLALGGLIFAYMKRGMSEPMKSHIDFQITTFWYGLAILLVGMVLSLVLIGYLIVLFWAVWTFVRCLTGLLLLNEGKPVTRVESFGFVAKG